MESEYDLTLTAVSPSANFERLQSRNPGLACTVSKLHADFVEMFCLFDYFGLCDISSVQNHRVDGKERSNHGGLTRFSAKDTNIAGFLYSRIMSN